MAQPSCIVFKLIWPLFTTSWVNSLRVFLFTGHRTDDGDDDDDDDDESTEVLVCKVYPLSVSQNSALEEYDKAVCAGRNP